METNKLSQSSEELLKSNEYKTKILDVFAKEVRKGTASLIQRIHTGLDDLIIDSAQRLVISDQYGYESSVNSHKGFADLLNCTMNEFRKLTGEEIAESDRDMFLCFDQKRIKKTYYEKVKLKCEGIFPESLRQEHEKAYHKSTSEFFRIFLIAKFEPSCRMRSTPHFDLRRIRFVDGKALFNQEDADLLLREKFAIDFAAPPMRALSLEFHKLNKQYEKFRKFLEENISDYEIDLSSELLIGQNGALIEIDSGNEHQLRLNPYRLFSISARNKG